MTNAMKHIKFNVQEFPPLTLSIGEGQLILDIDASKNAWGVVLLQKIGNKEDVCTYA